MIIPSTKQSRRRDPGRTPSSCLAGQLCIATLLVVGLTVRHAHAQTAASTDTIRTVALTGQQAPGMPGGTNLQNLALNPFMPAFLNNAGHVMFMADTALGSGIWSDRSGQVSLVARTGSPAPGAAANETFHFFWQLAMDEAGQVSFAAQLTGPETGQDNEGGIWSEGPGGLTLVARDQDLAPGTPDFVRYRHLEKPSLMRNSTGRTVYSAGLSRFGQDYGSGIWSAEAGVITPIMVAGDRAPGTPEGVTFRSGGGGVYGKVVNDIGRVAFGGGITGPGVSHLMNEATDSGIWSQETGSLALVARAGEQAPGTPGGVSFGEFFPFAFNNPGHVVFAASLRGSGVDDGNFTGLWSNASGDLELVARGGSRAPGTPDGVNFSDFYNAVPSLNNAGQIAVLSGGSGLDSTNGRAIWLGDAANLELIAGSGSQAPGTASGVSFDAFTDPALNDAGQVAFLASLTSGGVDDTNDLGIWATDLTGAVQLIVRSGGLLEVGADDFRTIANLRMIHPHGSSDGRPSGFNDLGEIAFWAGFTDGSEGIFVSSLAAVPEPGTSLLLAFALPALLRRRRCSSQ